MRALTWGWVFVLAGCFQDSVSSDDSMAGPRAGSWLGTEGDAMDDTCAWADRPNVVSGEIEVANAGDGSFTMIPRGHEEHAACVLDQDEFTCDPVPSTLPVPQLDATVEAISVITGNLDTRERADGRYRMAVDCTGTQCAAATTEAGILAFPCSYTVPFVVAFVE